MRSSLQAVGGRLCGELGPSPPSERPRPEEAEVTREQYDAIYATVLAAQQDDSLPAHFYVSEILAIVSAEVTDNQTADGRPVAAAVGGREKACVGTLAISTRSGSPPSSASEYHWRFRTALPSLGERAR